MSIITGEEGTYENLRFRVYKTDVTLYVTVNYTNHLGQHTTRIAPTLMTLRSEGEMTLRSAVIIQWWFDDVNMDEDISLNIGKLSFPCFKSRNNCHRISDGIVYTTQFSDGRLREINILCDLSPELIKLYHDLISSSNTHEEEI